MKRLSFITAILIAGTFLSIKAVDSVKASQSERDDWLKEQVPEIYPIDLNIIYVEAPSEDLELSNKDRTCLIRNVFYEGPRYFPGAEKKFNVSSNEYIERIYKEWIRIIGVTHNRVKSSRYPNSFCAVIKQYKQFSWTLEKKKTVTPISKLYKDDEYELRNLEAISLLIDKVQENGYNDITDGAMYYHTHYVNPKWNKHKEVSVESKWHVYYTEKKS